MSTFDFLQQLYSFSNYMNRVRCQVILVVQVDETLFVLAVTIFITSTPHGTTAPSGPGHSHYQGFIITLSSGHKWCMQKCLCKG